VVDEHLAAFLTHHSCLGLTFDKHHQRTTCVTRVEHPPSSGIILSATRAFEQTLQRFIAASCKEFDTFQFFHNSIFSAQKYGKKRLM
jgi:hypothetical protein